MRIWVSGGGTAGHVYPALAVAEVAGTEMAEALWLGTAKGIESSVVPRHGMAFRAIDGGPLGGTSPLRLGLNVLRIARGVLQAWALMGQQRPDALLVTGGYASVPASLAAAIRRVPIVVYLPDVLPGRAVGLVARLAAGIAATSSRSLDRLPKGKAVATGYPVRTAVRAADRGEARHRLGLDPTDLLLLVFGGSRGARRINLALAGAAPALLRRLHIVHVTGSLDLETSRAARDALPAAARTRYRVVPYLDSEQMADALAAADLAVSRSGAAVMGEYPARGLPSILVPLPIAGGHQSANAAVLRDAGAACVIEDERLDADGLTSAILSLVDEPERRAAMARAARSLDRPDAAIAIWRLVAERAACRGTPKDARA